MSKRRVFVLCIVATVCAAILCASAASAAPTKMDSGFYYPTDRTTWTGNSGGSSGDPRQPWNDGSPGGRIYGYLDPAAPGGFGAQHVGMDIRTPYNGPVYAICDGTIYRYINTGDTRYYCIIVRHALADGTTFYAVYGHCRLKSGYSQGKAIKAGENFAQINESVNQHIHFGIKLNSDFSTGWGHLAIGKDANSLGWRPPRTWLMTHIAPGGSGGTTPPPSDGGGGGTTPPPATGLSNLVVTAATGVFSDGFFAQTQDGSKGYHLQYGTAGGPSFQPGDIVSVSSYSLSTVNGDQVYGSAVATDQGTGDEPDAINVTTTQMSNGTIPLDVLVRISGTVGYLKSDGTAFYLTDGSTVADAWHPGIRVLTKDFANGSAIPLPKAGATVTVVGVFSKTNVQGSICPCIRLRSSADLM